MPDKPSTYNYTERIQIVDHEHPRYGQILFARAVENGWVALKPNLEQHPTESPVIELVASQVQRVV